MDYMFHKRHCQPKVHLTGPGRLPIIPLRSNITIFKGFSMDKDRLIEALSREGNLCFPTNKHMTDILREPLTHLKSESRDGVTLWYEGDQPTPAGIRVKIYPTGHTVFYNTLGRRFLMTDPEGNPLHEAEWEVDEATQEIKLKQARCQLDCQQWVGIKPKAKKFSTHISIKGQPGWETMTLDQLRHGASQAWQVPHSEVEYFYKDENFVSTAEGEYDVNLYKDGLYALPGGTFETPVFISFMFTVQWEKLDLIPVVELFQSTLPGSGGQRVGGHRSDGDPDRQRRHPGAVGSDLRAGGRGFGAGRACRRCGRWGRADRPGPGKRRRRRTLWRDGRRIGWPDGFRRTLA